MKNISGLKGNRREAKGKQKQKFATLTEGHLVFSEVKQKDGFVRVPVKLVKTKEEIHKLTL